MIVSSGARVMNVWLVAEELDKATDALTLSLQHVSCVAGRGVEMKVTPDELTCLSQNSNKALRLLNTHSATRVDLKEPAGRLASCGAFSSHGKVGWKLARLPLGCRPHRVDYLQVAVGCSDGSVRLFSRGSGRRIGVMAGPVVEVSCCAYSPDNNTIATGSSDGSVRVWMPNLLVMRKRPICHKATVNNAVFAEHQASSLIATGSQDGSVLVRFLGW